MALGVTSKKRGAYFGYPVYESKMDAPIGIVVIKAFIDDIENEINKPYQGIMTLVDSHGVVFASNRAEWIYHVLWKVSNVELNEILKSRQFGAGPWDWTGIEKKDEIHAFDKSGKKYHIHHIGINNYPGWDIVYLHDHEKVLKNITSPFFKTAGYIILSLCVLIGISVTLLYKMASYDIIMRKRAQEELKKHLEMEKQFNRELEPLVAERTMSLIALTVADKLRNPASVIGLICRRLFKKLDDADKIKDGLDDIVNETHKLDKIVYDYKALLDSRKSVFEYDDINVVVNEAVLLIKHEAKEKGIKLITNLSDEPLKINLQKNLLRIAIYHLLFNAVEATPRSGTITILTLTSDDNAILEISDTGKGFKKDETEKVFDPFFSSKTHSYGMGLPLVMHIVIEHLGEIDVESEEGIGTTFRLAFPFRWIR
jgi:signal transduction histidine kinase